MGWNSHILCIKKDAWPDSCHLSLSIPPENNRKNIWFSDALRGYRKKPVGMKWVKVTRLQGYFYQFLQSFSPIFCLLKKNERMVVCILHSYKTLHKKIKFSIKDFFSKRDQIRSLLRIWSHLLKKHLTETSFVVQWITTADLWGHSKCSSSQTRPKLKIRKLKKTLLISFSVYFFFTNETVAISLIIYFFIIWIYCKRL